MIVKFCSNCYYEDVSVHMSPCCYCTHINMKTKDCWKPKGESRK